MDRDRLAELLATPGEAFGACRRAVQAGARFQVWDDGAHPASHYYRIYRLRHTRAQRLGTSSLGFATAVEALHAYGDQPVLLGEVAVAQPPYHYQLFLNADASAVIACLGVDTDQRRLRAHPQR